jgi:hypothetical protein
MKLPKVEVIAGTKIFNQNMDPKFRDKRVEDLNAGLLDCLIMMEATGGCGHTMTGASLMIFTSSLYTMAGERQCIGMFNTDEFLLILGRMCRQGQLSPVVSAVIIADPDFKGDSAAFKIKNERAAEDYQMNRWLRRDEINDVFERLQDRLMLEPKQLDRVRLAERRIQCEKMEADKHRKKEKEKRNKKIERVKAYSIDRYKLLTAGKDKARALEI